MELNWDAIGAVGEILGALAVVLTLIYVAKELNHTRDSSQISAADRLIEGFDQINRLVATDSSVTVELERFPKLRSSIRRRSGMISGLRRRLVLCHRHPVGHRLVHRRQVVPHSVRQIRRWVSAYRRGKA